MQLSQDEATLNEILAQSNIPDRDKREYRELFETLEHIKDKSPEIIGPIIAAFQVGLFALGQDIRIKKLRSYVRRGDLRPIMPGIEPEAYFTQMLKDLLSPDQLADFDLQNQQKKEFVASLDCKDGCWLCCANQPNIPATHGDVEAIWDKIKGSEDALGPRLHPNACPALASSGRCAAYDQRPLACRSHGSTSVDACRRSFNDADKLPGDEKCFSLLSNVLSPDMVLQALSVPLGISVQYVDLPVALRALQNGAQMDRALADAAAYQMKWQRQNDSDKTEVKFM